MGGRGASSAKGGKGSSTFSNTDDFEKSLTGFDDPRLKEYTDAYNTESNYNSGLKKVMEQAIGEDGYDAVKTNIESEEKQTKKQLNNMPNKKTPKQLGEQEALKERLNIINDLKKKSGTQGKGKGDVDITKEKRG